MAPNSPQTILSLEDFREIAGWHPYWFWQLSNQKLPLTDYSDLLVAEYQYQRMAAPPRSELRRSIAVAEQKLAGHLNYDVGTRYHQAEVYPAGRVDYYGSQRQILNLKVCKLQRIATVSYEELTEFSFEPEDSDNDDLDDTFIGTFTDTGTDPAQVLIAFKPEDRPANRATASSSNPVDWQIRPVNVTRKDDNTLQVIGPYWLLVKPSKYETPRPAAGYNGPQTGINTSGAIDPDIEDNFVSSLVAYKKVYSAENEVTLVRRYGSEEQTWQVTATIFNAEYGQVAINWLSYCGAFNPGYCGPGGIEEIRVNYEAGCTGEERAANSLDMVTARFAIAELPQPASALKHQNPQFYFWQQDLSRVGSQEGGDYFRVDNAILGNSFRNTRRGAVEAWRAVSALALYRAINY